MKKLAKLVLNYSFSFVVLLLLAGSAGILAAWAGAAAIFPPGTAGNAAAAVRGALPAAFYGSLLLGLSYGFRRRVPYPVVLVLLLALSLALSGAVSMVLARYTTFPEIQPAAAPAPRPGFILGDPNPGPSALRAAPVTQTVFLEGPAKAAGARIVFPPGRPASFLETGAPYRDTPVRLPFREESHPFLGAINGDLAQSARYLEAWFNAGLPAFAIYAGSLSLLLIALGCLFNISFWPLANLFFGALVFRGVLALEVFLNEPSIHGLLSGFVPASWDSLVNPLLHTVLAILILLYAGLVYLARGKRGGDG